MAGAKMPSGMKQIKSWTVSDELWAKLEPLVPARQRAREQPYRRKPGGGRKPMPARRVFSAIVYVLRTGCQWKALPCLDQDDAATLARRLGSDQPTRDPRPHDADVIGLGADHEFVLPAVRYSCQSPGIPGQRS